MTKKNKYFITFGVVLLVLIFDQAIKIWVKTKFHAETDFFDQPINLIGSWFQLDYTENQGMAFGTTLGGGLWGKLVLSLFRIVAIGGIVYYIIKQIKLGVKTEYLIALGFVLAGAAGNLVDSMLYDYLFAENFDPCIYYNQLHGSGNFGVCEYYGIKDTVELRHQGFLFGNVVDMFQFEANWPTWMPVIGGNRVFPAIWNLADGAITVGVAMIILRQKTYFGKKKKKEVSKA